MQLERDKEHWMLEFKLLQRRYEKLSSANASPRSNDGDANSNTRPHTTVDATTDAEREEFIKKHFSDKITELSRQLQLADSKAIHFFSEVRTRIYGLFLDTCTHRIYLTVPSSEQAAAAVFV